LSKNDYENLLKLTDRAIMILVAWKKIYLGGGHGNENDFRIRKADAVIAIMAEYRFELNGLLKGDGEFHLDEKLRFLIEEIDRAEPGDVKNLYLDQLVKLTKGILTEGIMEVIDAGK